MRNWGVIPGRRYPILFLIAMVLLLWTASWLVIMVRDNRRIEKFRSLKIGMSRNDLVQIVGEPQHKEAVAAVSRLFPAIGKGGGERYVEYSYYLDSFSAGGGTGIRGIILDEAEERIKFIDLKTEIIDHFRVGRAAFLLVACAIIAFLAWILFTGFSRRIATKGHRITYSKRQ